MSTLAEVARRAGAGEQQVAHHRARRAAAHRPPRLVMMQIAIAVTTTARRYGHDVLLITDDEGPAGVWRVVGSGLADAVILMDVELDDERIPVLRELRFVHGRERSSAAAEP
jgi:hypothetical protein